MKKLLWLCFIAVSMAGRTQSVNTRGAGTTSVSPIAAGTTYAIVIGISQYQEVPCLKFADRDAAIFADFLVNKRGMALDSANVRLFVNQNATLNNIGNALSDILEKKLKKGDRIIFFFAGHGDYDAKILQDQALLLLYGVPKRNYFQNIFGGDFISTAELNERFIQPVSRAGCEVILIIDACHANGLNTELSGGAEGGRITAAALQNMTSAVKLYSCRSDEFSLESRQWGGGRGLFSYVLMEGLYGMADANNDKVVTLRELQRYLEDNVPKLAEPGKQDPVVKMDDGAEPIARVNDEFLASYKKIKDKELVFLAEASSKGDSGSLIEKMDSALRQLYHECDSFIFAKNLNAAYNKYLLFSAKDSTSEASLLLKRNLSAALQSKAADILAPAAKDMTYFGASERQLRDAEDDLEKAANLLGRRHFLYKNLLARILFLKSEVIDIKYRQFNGIDSIHAREEIAYFEKSSALEPNATYTYFMMGVCFNDLHEYYKAEVCYQKYLALIPNSVWGNLNLGYVNLSLKKYEQALAFFKRSIALDSNPEYPPYFDCGFIYRMIGKNDSAIPYLNKGLSLHPYHVDSAWAYQQLGTVYYSMRMYPEAANYFQLAVNITPDDKWANASLGHTYATIGQYTEAIRYHLKAVSLDSNFAVEIYNLSCAYSNLKMAEKSLYYLEKSIQKGYLDLKNMETDTDLNNVRQLAEFKKVLDRNFPKQPWTQYPRMFKPNSTP